MDPSDVTKDDTTKDFDLDGSEHADNGHHKSEDGLDQKTNGVADSLDDSNPGAGSDSHKGDLSKGGNEDKKIFVGGIAYDVSNEDLMTYFAQYGEVAQAQVKYDRTTGRSRGFAFVEFATGDACKAALQLREQTIKNKQVEVKPAKSRENKKVFVGGLPSDHPEEELRKHFEQYGKVEDIEWPFDKQRNARRNFAFIVFEEEDAADRASAFPKQMFGERECDVKKAVPQGKRFGAMGGAGGGRGGNFRGGYGGRGGGFFGGANGGWGQMGGMGAYGGGWGDWYGGAGNFYGGGSGGYGGYGGGYYDDYSSNNYNDYWGGSGGSGTGGYDSYSQGTGATGGGHQTGRSGGGGAGRYQQHQQQY